MGAKQERQHQANPNSYWLLGLSLFRELFLSLPLSLRILLYVHFLEEMKQEGEGGERNRQKERERERVSEKGGREGGGCIIYIRLMFKSLPPPSICRQDCFTHRRGLFQGELKQRGNARSDFSDEFCESS